MDLDMREADASAGTVAMDPDLQAQDGDFPLPLLPGDEAPAGDGAPPAELILPEEPPAPPAGDPETRKRRRADWERSEAVRRRWELQRRLADVSADVEALSREVTRVRADLHVPLPPLAALPDFERQTLAAAHARRLADILQSQCRKAMAAVMQHKWSWPFNAPVDTNVYKDYLEKVGTPMDFGTIKKKMDAKEYAHPDHWGADMRLVFANAKAYNKPGSDVHVMAATLEEKFEERYGATVAGRVAEENTVAEAEALAARKRYAGAAAAAGGARAAAEARAAQLVRAVDQLAAVVADAKSAAAAACAPVSRAEKEALAAALGRLPQAHFEAAVGIVMHHHPGLQPFDEVGFDLDMLDALTLRQLLSFVGAAEAAGGGEGEDAAPVAWPALPVGAGLRPFSGKRKRRAGAAAAAAAPTPTAVLEPVAATPAVGADPIPAAPEETPAATLAAPMPPTAASEAPVAAVAAAPQAAAAAPAGPAPAAPNGTANGSAAAVASEAAAPTPAPAPAPPAAEDAGPAADGPAPGGAAAPDQA